MSANKQAPSSYVSINDAATPLYPKVAASQPQPQPQYSAPTYAQPVYGHNQAYATTVPAYQFYPAPAYPSHAGASDDHKSVQLVEGEDVDVSRARQQESCCARFWKGPFRARSYGLLLSNIFVQFPLAFMTTLWVGGYFFLMFGGMAPMIVGMIFGPIVTLMVIVSWEWLVNLELRSQLYAGRDHRGLQEANLGGRSLCLGVGARLSKHKETLRTWEGFWAAFKDLTWRWSAWRPAFYFILIKPAVAFFSAILSFITFFGGLALTFNFVLVATCARCRNGHWAGHDKAHWLFGTYQGSSVTVPLGLFLIFLACFIGSGLARSSARIAAYFLLKKPSVVAPSPSGQSQDPPTQSQQTQTQPQAPVVSESVREQSDIETPLMGPIVQSHSMVQPPVQAQTPVQ